MPTPSTPSDEKFQIDDSWKEHLVPELSKDYMVQLKGFLANEYTAKKVIFPPPAEIFSAFNLTPFGETKVVIIGQDPYHGPGQAHGLCFSVKPGVKPPPSLVNIYKEIHQEFGTTIPTHGYLESWAKQGVLLLNNVLTVERSKAGSHRSKGWELFTDKVIETLNEKKENLVFLLWGRDAKTKGAKIDRQKHLVLESGHPSPFSAHLFLGNGHFKKANDYLEQHGKTPISWAIQ